MMQLVRDGAAVPFLVESQAHEGVRRVAGKVAQDVQRVSGALPSANRRDSSSARSQGRSAHISIRSLSCGKTGMN